MLRLRSPLLIAFRIPRHHPSKWNQRRYLRIEPAPNLHPTTAPPNRRRFRYSYIWYTLILLTGSSFGLLVREFASPSLPLPGTHDDELALASLTAAIDALPIVKQMRAQLYHLHADMPLVQQQQQQRQRQQPGSSNSAQQGWIELDIKRHITESRADWGKATRTATGETMAGFRGLGVQRAFWNAETRELVAVVWIGGALGGWPGLAHGGAIATIFEDAMSRMVAGPDVSIDSVAQPASISVTYAKPTNSTNFYVLRAAFADPEMPQAAPPSDPEPAPAKSWLPSWKDLTKKAEPPKAMKTVEINGTLEDLDGRLRVRAKGIFPVPG